MVLDIPAGKIARPIITIDEDANITAASKVMVENDRGSVVVTRKGETVGFLTERDVMNKVVASEIKKTKTKVREVMTSSPVTIEKEKSLREAIDLMNRKGVRRMLVTEGGKIVGIFTLRDIVRHTRVCAYCGKDIMSAIESTTPDSYVECDCGSRYHRKCAETVVHCVNCSKTIVTHVVYPEPSETFSG